MNFGDIINLHLGKEKRIREIAYLIAGCFIIAVAYNIFFLPNNIVCFGISGLSIVVKEFGINPVSFIFVMNILLLILSYIFLGKEKTKNSIIGSLVFPIFAYLTEDLSLYFPTNDVEMIVNAIFGAVIAGIGYGFVFKTGYTTGGTDIISQIFAKYSKVSVGKNKFLADGIIVVSGLLVYSWEILLYGIVILYIISIMIDKIILGISASKVFYILTEKEKEIKEYLLNIPNCGVTIIKAKGGYSNDNKSLLLTAIPTRSYFAIKENLKKIDEKIFFLVCDAYEVNKNNKEILK